MPNIISSDGKKAGFEPLTGWKPKLLHPALLLQATLFPAAAEAAMLALLLSASPQLSPLLLLLRDISVITASSEEEEGQRWKGRQIA